MSLVRYIDAQKVPGRNGPPASEVYQLWVENPEGLRAVTFGTRVPQQVLPHDHGNRRGLNLEAPLLQSTLGPQATPGSAIGSWLPGVPLFAPVPPLSFAETPKLIWAQRLEIVGGVKEGYLEVVIEFAPSFGTFELTLRAQLRPLEEAGTDVGEGTGSSPVIITSLIGAGRAVRNSCQFSNLADLGPSSYDRVVLAELWLSEDPPFTQFRLCAVAWINGPPDTNNPYGEPLEFKPPRVTLEVASIQTGKIAQSDVIQQAHTVWNQVGFECLGGSPGSNADLTPNRSAPFRRLIQRRHRHTGRSFVDPDTGRLASDGAVVNLPLGEAVFVDDLDDTASNLISASPSKGLLLHPTDTLSVAQGWLQVQQRIEAPMGLPEFLMQARISFSNNKQVCRLYWYLQLRDLGKNLIDAMWVATGSAIDTEKSGTLIRALVEPLEGVAWVQNAIRLGNGLGLWTQKAAKNPLPAEVRTIANLPRATKIMRMKYTPTQTGPILLLHAFALEIGAEGSLDYDNSARLCALKVWPAPGY